MPIGLTDRSYESICGSGNPLPCGLGDVSHGETVYFNPLAEVMVDIPETLPLSIFTAGVEVENWAGFLSPFWNPATCSDSGNS